MGEAEEEEGGVGEEEAVDSCQFSSPSLCLSCSHGLLIHHFKPVFIVTLLVSNVIDSLSTASVLTSKVEMY